MSQDRLLAALLELLLRRRLLTLEELEETVRSWERSDVAPDLAISQILEALKDRLPPQPESTTPCMAHNGPFRVLLVDDVKVIRDMIKGTLSLNGYLVVGEAVDGQEAVEMYEKCKPDLIIMDIEMKGTNGLEALRQIRKLDRRIPVVLMTGNPNKTYVQEALKWGTTDFLTKPLDLNRLYEVLKNLQSEIDL